MTFIDILKTIINFLITHPIYTSTTVLSGTLDYLILKEMANKIRKKGYIAGNKKTPFSTYIFMIITILCPIINLLFTFFLSKQLNDVEEKFINEAIKDGHFIKKPEIEEVNEVEKTPNKVIFDSINPRGPIEINLKGNEKVMVRSVATESRGKSNRK